MATYERDELTNPRSRANHSVEWPAPTADAPNAPVGASLFDVSGA